MTKSRRLKNCLSDTLPLPPPAVPLQRGSIRTPLCRTLCLYITSGPASERGTESCICWPSYLPSTGRSEKIGASGWQRWRKRETRERGRRWLFAPKGNETSHRSKISLGKGGQRWFKEEHDDDKMKHQTKVERETLEPGNIGLSCIRWQVEVDKLRKRPSEF